MPEGYSRVYKTFRGSYRYNHATEELERLGRCVFTTNYCGRELPYVDTVVVHSIHLSAEKFSMCPGYWVELYESILGYREAGA